MTHTLRITFAVFTLYVAAVAGSVHDIDQTSPVGLWKTFDDKTGEAKSIVRIYADNGELYARIERPLGAGEESRTCTQCKDERRNQPLIGLVIMRHMKAVKGEYRDGDILDPDNGSVYRCRLRLEDGGRKLNVRGFIGLSLFGRSQTWERQQ